MSANFFASLQPSPGEHFKVCFYGAVLSLFHHVSRAFGSSEAAFEHFPFLAGYNNELAQSGLAGMKSGDALDLWLSSLQQWEDETTGHLPLRALRAAGRLDHYALTLLMSIGLIEEDLRFGQVFEVLQGTPGQHRPTSHLLDAWWRDDSGWFDARANLRLMRDLGLVRVVNPDAVRLEWTLEIPGLLWDALRGDEQHVSAPWLRYRRHAELPSQDELILEADVRQQLTSMPELLASGQARTLIVRGVQRNGRRTAVASIAQTLGYGVLEISGLLRADDERWPLVGPLATALHAIPVMVFDLGPQETADVPRLGAYDGPSAIVLSKAGGVNGEHLGGAITVTLDMPDAGLRRLHWLQACGDDHISAAEHISERFRLTGGNIQRAARLAQTYAALSRRTTIHLADVQQASRTLNRQTIDNLAVRLETFGDWSQLAIGHRTRTELDNLESRCRHREHLRDVVGTALAPQLNPGVRALLSGPSGTGKTLAARLLAAALQMDIYRLDLSSLVNKYIGETEKNLNQIFSRAEELDVMLLLDEGDALLTQRTDVQTSNDRYANLETNFLLQRLESFEGILIVTTNAGDRIDSAFQRRMDVVIEFLLPDQRERWALWQLHLPAAHAVDMSLLEEVAGRCVLTGGQIRNAALHASLLAVRGGGTITSEHLEVAVEREYQKLGATCPLRPRVTI